MLTSFRFYLLIWFTYDNLYARPGSIKKVVPSQVNPFPEYPTLHSHSNDPGLLEHLAFTSHGPPRHSLISRFLE